MLIQTYWFEKRASQNEELGLRRWSILWDRCFWNEQVSLYYGSDTLNMNTSNEIQNICFVKRSARARASVLSFSTFTVQPCFSIACGTLLGSLRPHSSFYSVSVTYTCTALHVHHACIQQAPFLTKLTKADPSKTYIPRKGIFVLRYIFAKCSWHWFVFCFKKNICFEITAKSL